jgi:tetratricopeptide (TPR) repeat protein
LDSAIQEFRQAQQHWPEYANAHWNLGVELAKLGDLEGEGEGEREVTAWAQAERVDPSIVPIHDNVSALVTYNYGIGLLKQGDLSQAITEWEQALHIKPDLAEVHYTLGQAYQIKGNTGRGQSKSIDRETMKEKEERMKTQVPDDE